MQPVLTDLTVVELDSFVAGPSCGLYLAQLGAEVIRIDPPKGGADANRWPLSPEGRSLYWEGLNKGKKSVAIDIGRPEGRELAAELICAPGEGKGIFMSNFAPKGFFSHDNLSSRRDDLITIRIMGWADNRTAVDYTVNAALGVPLMTGPADTAGLPVNHTLPAWDLLTGSHAAFSLLVAERYRARTGAGQEVRIPLGDVAAATLGNLGQVAEVTIGGDRPKLGNDLFGGFGRDFATSDGHRVMVVAITPGQWKRLVECLGLAEAVAEVERRHDVDLATEEGRRFELRGELFAIFSEAMEALSLEQLTRIFGEAGVCWSPYRTVAEAVSAEAAFAPDNGLYSPVTHQSGLSYPTPRGAAAFGAADNSAPAPAPLLGADTERVLADTLGLSAAQIGKLFDSGVAAPGPEYTDRKQKPE